MTEEKQIVEIARVLLEASRQDNKDIHKGSADFDSETIWEYGRDRLNGATALYNAGYRQQSDFVSEIFANFERLMLDGEIGGKYPVKVINPDKFAELKNKYIKDLRTMTPEERERHYLGKW